MKSRKLKDSLQNLATTLSKLENALLVPKETYLAVEGTIKCFDNVILVFWKVLQRALEYEGIITRTPRESLREAYKINWIEDENLWLNMLEELIDTSHLYLHEDLQEEKYDDISIYAPKIREVYNFLSKRYDLTN